MTKQEASETHETVATARQEMYEALKLFHTHVQQTTALLLGVLTAVFIVFGISASREAGVSQNVSHLARLGGVILILLFPIAAISCSIIGRYYRLYVSALLFAGVLERQSGSVGHAWLQDIPSDPTGYEPWIRRRTYGWGHSWILYSSILLLIGIVGLLGGIDMLAINP